MIEWFSPIWQYRVLVFSRSSALFDGRDKAVSNVGGGRAGDNQSLTAILFPSNSGTAIGGSVS